MSLRYCGLITRCVEGKYAKWTNVHECRPLFLADFWSLIVRLTGFTISPRYCGLITMCVLVRLAAFAISLMYCGLITRRMWLLGLWFYIMIPRYSGLNTKVGTTDPTSDWKCPRGTILQCMTDVFSTTKMQTGGGILTVLLRSSHSRPARETICSNNDKIP